jgi:hypothetical protein
MPIWRSGTQRFHATSRVAQGIARESGGTRRFMRYRIEVPQPESERGSGRELKPEAE